ncbi:hypothetical protein EYC59_03440 [Candidatus Saccharibacteria bacterium]|nr:MAG: hypothetical protein EYC59_03440 [Candidatus Saccharibacteria bacterium]
MNKAKIKLFLTVLAVATAGSFMFAKPASALNPNDIPGGMRSDISNYDGPCPGMPEKYALYTWISPSGQPTQTSLTVPYGTQDVNLDLNQLVFVCRQYVNTNGASYPGLPQDGTVSPTAYNGSISKATSGFSATNGSLQNIGGLQSQNSIFRNNGTRYWFSNPVQFTYHANSPMTSSQVVIVSFNQKFANIFGGGIACAVPPGPSGYVGSLDNCNEGGVGFAITINVNSPQWSLSSNATANRGTMFPGETATFNYSLRNNGPDTASFQYVTRVQEYIGGVPQPINPVSRPNGDGSWPVPNAFEPGLPGGASVSSYSVRSYTALANPNLTRVCSWIEYAPRSSSNGAPDSSRQACITVSQPVPSCASFTTNPTVVEPGVPFTAAASVTYQNAQAAFWTYQSGGRLFTTITGPGGYNVDRLYPGVPPSASDISYSGFAFPAPPTSGLYTVTYGIRGGAIGNITCTAPLVPPIPIGYHPYFRVDAGDVSAGAGFTKADGTCTASTAAQIRGSNKGSSGSPAFLGAGAQLGALALGAISGFPTSTNEGGGSSGVGAGTGSGLTFANTPSLGSFGSLPCMRDYATEALTNASTISPLAAGSYNLGTLADGTYQVTSGDVTLRGNIPQGRKVTIVVMGGNAIIDGDITYGGYPSLSSAPQFKLIVTNGGNIKIKNDVTELHGAYIALPNTTTGLGGTVSTCYDTTTNTDSTDYNTCNYKLTFYGAVVANTLLLERTFGSLTASGSTVREPAETFNNTPELWAAPGSNTSSTGVQTYDSIISLPPVL